MLPFWDVDRSLGNANYGGADNAFSGSTWWKVYAGSGTEVVAFLAAPFQDDNYTSLIGIAACHSPGSLVQYLLARIEATASQLTNGANAASISQLLRTGHPSSPAPFIKRWNTLKSQLLWKRPAQRNRQPLQCDLR